MHHLRRWRVPSVVRQPISLALSMMVSPMEEGIPTEAPAAPPTGGHQETGGVKNEVASPASVEEGEEEEEDDEDEERESLENRAFVTAESPVARQ